MTRPGDKRPGWQFWIDRGGTFTDVVAQRPDGTLVSRKYLSEQPGTYDDAAAAAIADLLAAEPDAGRRVDAVRIGTTVATNALLEGRAPALALIVTGGFEDLLAIGDQRRDALFALEIVKRPVAVEHIVGCRGRMTADGETLRAPDEAAMAARLTELRAAGVTTIAVSLLHGWRHPAHERTIGRIARRIGFDSVVCSHGAAPSQGYLARTETTLADAWLRPIVRNYVARFRRALAEVCDCHRLSFMQSNGGLVDADAIRGKDAVLSGPAGGIVAIAKTSGDGDRLIGFDMGGTSTDICVWQGELERRSDNRIGGYRIATPMLRLETIAAGGGSMLLVNDERLCVGPASAGAEPGPAAYGKGGPATLTDANVVLGRLPAAHVPAAFGPDGHDALSRDASKAALDTLCASLQDGKRAADDVATLAESFLAVAVDNMASAIRRAVLERGEDVRGFELVAFGGAAGQVACLVADALGIDAVRLHPLAGVFSALGIGLAERMTLHEVPVGVSLDDAHTLLPRLVEAQREATGHGGRLAFSVVLQSPGTDTPLAVELDGVEAMRAAFDEQHRRRFGLAVDTTPDVVALRVQRLEDSDPERHPANAVHAASRTARGTVHATLRVGGRDVSARILSPTEIGASAQPGPIIVVDTQTTLVVDPGWAVQRHSDGTLRLQRSAARTLNPEISDAALLEVFNNRFRLVAEQMGHVLERTAHSVNIRERLDFSCALFDDAGRLIANAPHMPVHLGSMGATVQQLITSHGAELAAGDVVALNSPYAGGTHLPDITLVQAWSGRGHSPFCYLATRAHHADVGGISPGSMPADSREIGEEGVVLDGLVVVHDGRFDEPLVRATLSGHRWPVRNLTRNLADLRAQVAALNEGARQVDAMCGQFGEATVADYMQRVRANAALAVRRALRGIAGGEARVDMDNGLTIHVRIDVDGEHARVDFAGTSAQHDGNFNAPLAVTRAALLYVLRTLVDHDIPLNDGCLAGVELRVPAGSVLNPVPPAAVVAGNVETSQCVTNALYAALGVMAHAQGTMNNLTFGNDRVQYYETIAGGTGAGADFDGADAVQSHMTNSRMTDTEVLESRLPVRVERFCIRRDSGGAGRRRGGDGVVRHLVFTDDVTVTLLGGFRQLGPAGLRGGGDGKPGRNTVRYRDGRTVELPSVTSIRLACGDALIIETPGGGGFGPAQARSR